MTGTDNDCAWKFRLSITRWFGSAGWSCGHCHCKAKYCYGSTRVSCVLNHLTVMNYGAVRECVFERSLSTLSNATWTRMSLNGPWIHMNWTCSISLTLRIISGVKGMTSLFMVHLVKSHSGGRAQKLHLWTPSVFGGSSSHSAHLAIDVMNSRQKWETS